jgi:predicted HTH transcriptional regulator
MNAQEVSDLIQHGESEALEFKLSLGELKEIVETAGAFATTSGGTILVGLSPQKEVIGVQIGMDTLESLANTIKQNTEPAALPSIFTVQVKGRITDREYVELTEVSSRTATRDLVDLVRNGVLRQHGKGKGSYFELTR